MADINNPREFLESLLNAVDSRDSAKSILTKGEEQKNTLDTQLSSLKNTIEREKSETLRKRKIDLQAGYDKQIRAAQSEINSAQNKRKKALDEAMTKRIGEATKTSRESAANDEKAFKAYVSAQKLPVLMRSKMYYSLFCPGVIGYIVLLLFFLLVMIISILGIRANYPGGGYPLFGFTVLAVLDLAALIIYILIWTNTRVKYRDQIIQAKAILKSIKNHEKTINDMEKNIRKVGDDNSYGLEEFDRIISEKNAVKAGIEAQKAAALNQYENETKGKLEADIDANYKTRLDELSSKLMEAENTLNAARAQFNDQEALLTRDFVSFVGSENLTHENASRLLTLINDGTASSVTEAVNKLNGDTKVTEENKT